jgi:hypothetical protein
MAPHDAPPSSEPNVPSPPPSPPEARPTAAATADTPCDETSAAAPPCPPTQITPTTQAVTWGDIYFHWGTIIFTLQVPTVCRVGLRTLLLGFYSEQHASLAVAIPILLFEAACALQLFVHMRSLQRATGVRESQLSKRRLRVRLRYVMAKYNERSLYWQFVLWSRQLALIGISTAFQPRGTQDTGMLLLEALLTLSVLTISLALHVIRRPYAYRHQNRLEYVLGGLSILAVTVSYVTRSMQLTPAMMAVCDFSVLAMLLIPALVVALWLVFVGASRNPASPHCEPLLPDLPTEEGGKGTRTRGVSPQTSINSPAAPVGAVDDESTLVPRGHGAAES